jgi:hypothetical protein
MPPINTVEKLLKSKTSQVHDVDQKPKVEIFAQIVGLSVSELEALVGKTNNSKIPNPIRLRIMEQRAQIADKIGIEIANPGQAGRALLQLVKSHRETQLNLQNREQKYDYKIREAFLNCILPDNVIATLEGKESDLDLSYLVECIKSEENWRLILSTINIYRDICQDQITVRSKLINDLKSLKDSGQISESKFLEQYRLINPQLLICQKTNSKLVNAKEIIDMYKNQIGNEVLGVSFVPTFCFLVNNILMLTYEFNLVNKDGIRKLLPDIEIESTEKLTFDRNVQNAANSFFIFSRLWCNSPDSQKKFTQLVNDNFPSISQSGKFKYVFPNDNEMKKDALKALDLYDEASMRTFMGEFKNTPLINLVNFIDMIKVLKERSHEFRTYYTSSIIELAPESHTQIDNRVNQRLEQKKLFESAKQEEINEQRQELLEKCILTISDVKNIVFLENTRNLLCIYDIDNANTTILDKIEIQFAMTGLKLLSRGETTALIANITQQIDLLNKVRFNREKLNILPAQELKDQTQYGFVEFEDFKIPNCVHLSPQFKSVLSNFCLVNKTDITFTNKMEKLLRAIGLNAKNDETNIYGLYYDIINSPILSLPRETLLRGKEDRPKYTNLGLFEFLEFKLDQRRRLYIILNQQGKYEFVAQNLFNGVHGGI